ncbi:hypothetical protein ACROYT_G011265 [Oculina patagonica]
MVLTRLFLTKKSQKFLVSRKDTRQLQSLANLEGKRGKCENWRFEPTRFSSWIRLQARVWRVVYNMRIPKDRVNGQKLLPEEIEDAEEEIISRAQLEAFPEKYEALMRRKEIPKKSSLGKLCAWLDYQGVMLCGGRLQFPECLPYDVRFPVILVWKAVTA